MTSERAEIGNTSLKTKGLNVECTLESVLGNSTLVYFFGFPICKGKFEPIRCKSWSPDDFLGACKKNLLCLKFSCCITCFFFLFRNPTPKNILGVHWDMAKQGEILEFLAVNTTENSTTLWNYRQRECAFWTDYLPTVIGYITPTYPPTTEVSLKLKISPFEVIF